MPAYDSSPTAKQVLMRTRERIKTPMRAMNSIAAGEGDVNELVRQISKNVEMLLDPTEIRQVAALKDYATEFNRGVSSLNAKLQGFRFPVSVEPERAFRVRSAISALARSPLSSGSFF